MKYLAQVLVPLASVQNISKDNVSRGPMDEKKIHRCSDAANKNEMVNTRVELATLALLAEAISTTL
jgi:hypothetical protein